MLFSSTRCESLHRDIELYSVENNFEHYSYMCNDCLKGFGFFGRVKDWHRLETHIHLIPYSKNQYCEVCFTLGGEKNKGIYAPYFKCQGYFDFLQDHLTYCSKNLECKCYWPEINENAAEINDICFTLFLNLFRTTALKQVVNDGDKQKELLSAEPLNSTRFSSRGFVIALLSKCFFYSHYYRVCQDIDRYSKKTFSDHSYAVIQQKLENITTLVGEKYLKLYGSCLKKHQNKRIGLESELIQNDLYFYDQASFYGQVSTIENVVETSSVMDNEETCCCEEEVFNWGKCSESPYPFLLAVKKNENIHQIGWLESQILLQQGSLFNRLLLYKQSIRILSKAIKKNPLNAEAYIERAFAYFETNQLPLALKDYEDAKKLIVIVPFEIGVKGLYNPENKTEFTLGLLSGVLDGAKTSTVEFVPSILSSCRGILNGLWAFACSPIEVSKEMSAAAYSLGEFISRNSANECLSCVVPELKDLSLSWSMSNDNLKGKKIGYIIGKYGIDIFAPIGILKGVNKINALRKANTMLTLESCVAEAKQVKILEESVKRAALRETIVVEAAKEGKILVKSSNVVPHVMQPKHAWNKIIELTGDIEKDFKSLLLLLEENGIFAEKYFLESQAYHQGKIVRSDYRKMINGVEVKAIFETYVETNQTFLKDAWVITK